MIIVNNQEVKFNRFPNNESYIDVQALELLTNDYTIILKFESDEDLIHLYFLKKYLDEKKLQGNLIIPYLPYSRMDRTEDLRLFTLKYVTKLINDMNFNKVEICEPHSDVSLALLDRVHVKNTTLEITKKVMSENLGKDLYIVYPDAGAEKRYSKHIKSKYLTCTKERDFETGEIIRLEINLENVESGFTAIIVDDLCSKGGTFDLAAKRLRDIGAIEIILVVTHCENTIFDGNLLDNNLINKIYTTNSILDKNHNKINIMDILWR